MTERATIIDHYQTELCAPTDKIRELCRPTVLFSEAISGAQQWSMQDAKFNTVTGSNTHIVETVLERRFATIGIHIADARPIGAFVDVNYMRPSRNGITGQKFNIIDPKVMTGRITKLGLQAQLTEDMPSLPPDPLEKRLIDYHEDTESRKEMYFALAGEYVAGGRSKRFSAGLRLSIALFKHMSDDRGDLLLSGFRTKRYPGQPDFASSMWATTDLDTTTFEAILGSSVRQLDKL